MPRAVALDAPEDALAERTALEPEWLSSWPPVANAPRVRVAVIDSGWDHGLADPRVVAGIGLVAPDDDFSLLRSTDDADRIGHGTMCTDLVLQAAPNAEILPVRVFGHRLETSPDILCAAVRYAIEGRARVVNLSLGTQRDDAVAPLYLACEEATRAGVIVIAAADNRNAWSYPAVFENVIGVAAADLPNPFHYLFRPGHALECVAKGVGQRGRTLGGSINVVSGTSVATPMITALTCRFLEREPHATLDRVRELLAQFAAVASDESARR
jgi:subtilisin family serine protease